MESKLSIVRSDGSPAGEFDLDPAWLEMKKGEQAVHDTVVAFLAKQRSGTANTKTRSEVRGTGGKPYRQKGTGRARAGTRQSPIWRGGGIAFGPKPRSFAKKVNFKVKRLALKRAFSERVAAGDVMVVDQIALDSHKTKNLLGFLNAMQANEEVLLVVDQVDRNLALASRNLPDVKVMKDSIVNSYWLLLFKKIIFTKAALDSFGKRLETIKREARK